MYRAIQTLLVALCLLISYLATGLRAEENIRPLVDALGATAFPQKIEAVKALAASGDPKVGDILKDLSDGKLYAPKTGGTVYLEDPAGGAYLDVLTGAAVSDVPGNLAKICLNNGLRGAIGAALSQLTLLSPDRAARLSASQDLLKDANPDNLALLNSALAEEKDAEIKSTMEAARAVILLKTDASAEDKKAAIDTIAARGNRDALTILTAAMDNAPDDLKPAIQAHINAIERSLAVWDVAQNVWYGLSLGSVLLLAAIGLAITFGVMGIINMAHGEMVMLGAYTTYVVQQTIAAVAPGMADFSLAFAVPAAFLFTGLVGVCIERSVIRWLYGRPLETLLATWGISLILQQAIRTIFGPTNRQVDNPSWMSGAFEVGGLAITYNRMWIIVFSLGVFVALLLLLEALQVRPADACRDTEPPHGLGHGHPHPLCRRHDLRPRLRHCGAGRRGADPDRQHLTKFGPELHHRQFHGRGLWRCRQSLGHAGRRADTGRRQQVSRTLCRRGVGQDPDPGPHHPLHPAPPKRAVRPQGTGGGTMITQMLFSRHEKKTVWAVFLILLAAALVPLANLLIPEDSVFHVPGYLVPLLGKYLCYALLALALDLVWGYCGILSLGHGAFFALGGYAMGMYLMRQIGDRGVYANPLLPDFMVFLNWSELPWYWYGFNHFAFAALMVLLVPGLLAFVFGWFAFRSRVTGVYLSIITQAMTYALLLAFFRNEMGFGGNNGLTDFKEILGFNVQAGGTRAALLRQPPLHWRWHWF